MADMVLAPQRQWVRKSSLREASEASFRDGASAPDPESRDYGFDAPNRPGMTVAGCSFPAMTRKRPNLLTALRVGRSGRERAAVLFLGGGDHFQVLVGTRHRRAGGEDVPLILDLVGGKCRDRIHFVHQLMVGV